MKQLFIKKEGNPVLLLFFAGWGSDENLFGSPVPEGCDYLLCFDYKNMDFDYSLLGGYQEIRVLAWSMGVWVACQTLTGKDYPYGMRLAVNGTPYPIHDTKGIPEVIFRGTLENFSEPVLVRFRRRICGSAAQVKLFLAHHPYRTLDDLHQELVDDAEGPSGVEMGLGQGNCRDLGQDFPAAEPAGSLARRTGGREGRGTL